MTGFLRFVRGHQVKCYLSRTGDVLQTVCAFLLDHAPFRWKRRMV